jgi:hypothetical protein
VPEASVADFGFAEHSGESARAGRCRCDDPGFVLRHAVSRAWVNSAPADSPWLASWAEWVEWDSQASRDSADECCSVGYRDDCCRGVSATDCLRNPRGWQQARESPVEWHRAAPASHLHRPDECVLRVAAKRDGIHLACDCRAAGRVADVHWWGDRHLEFESAEYSRASRNGHGPPEFHD